ncbi:MAG: indolepyruvate oxidoreductase subunit beta [Actinomycetota bacterium]
MAGKTTDRITDILIVGVGGQGILLSADILARLLVDNGYDVKQAEIHGMSQRGGSVHSMVRFGKKIESPLISRGEADYLLAYEELEALRWAPFVRPRGTVIVNTQRIAPAPVALGVAAYPDDPVGRLKSTFKKTLVVEANKLGKKAGNVRAANMAMLGALASGLPFDKKQWIETITGRVPQKTLEINLKAFELGWEVKNV